VRIVRGSVLILVGLLHLSFLVNPQIRPKDVLLWTLLHPQNSVLVQLDGKVGCVFFEATGMLGHTQLCHQSLRRRRLKVNVRHLVLQGWVFLHLLV